jgi:hypothetical protein
VGQKKNGKWKVMNWHHTLYGAKEAAERGHPRTDTSEKEIIVKLCYVCHNLIHGRNKFYNPWEKKYGCDKGPLMFAYDVIQLYNSAMAKTATEIANKIQEEVEWKKDVLRQG